MAKKASKTAATGSSGQSFVQAEFEELGWGVSVVPQEHDLGTDLWLSPRDAQGFDLLSLAGAQVKNYKQEYFDKNQATDERGNILGWWYYEADDSHFSYWANHANAHFLVLRNKKLRKAFWVHVTSDRLQSTGQGTKILVPSDQILDETSEVALVEAATSTQLAGSWDGSAWAYDRIPAVDQLRFALLTPRLVAPHPNSGTQAIRPDQAIATLIQRRLDQLESVCTPNGRLEHPEVDDPNAWGWQLFDAIRDWTETRNTNGLSELDTTTWGSAGLVAAAVAHCSAQLSSGLVGDALGTVRDAKVRATDAAVVDLAWLSLHEGRCLFELGKYEEVLPIALEVQQLRSSHPTDPTAMALVAAATSLIFNISAFGQRSISELVQSSDTVARLWRSQRIASGLGSHFEGDYRAWGEDRSVRYVRSDEAADSLWAVTLISGFTADHDAWKYGQSLYSRRQLMAGPADSHAMNNALVDLLRTGDKKHFTLAVQRLMRHGPQDILQAIGNQIELSDLPRSSIHASLDFMRGAGDVLYEADADRHILWCMASLEDIESFLVRFRPMFLPREALVEAAAGLILACSDSTRTAFIDHFLTLEPINDDDQLLAKNYGQALRRIEPELWSEAQIRALTTRSGDNWELANALNDILVRHRPEHRETLLPRIREGDLGALQSFGRLDELDDEVARDAMDILARQIDGKIAQAKNGVHTFGSEPTPALTLLNVLFPEHADWGLLVRFFTEAPMPSDHLTGPMDILDRNADKVDGEVRDMLRPGIEAIRDRQPLDSLFGPGDKSHVIGVAVCLLARWYPSEVQDETLQTLVLSGEPGRIATSRILGRTQDITDVTVLAALAEDKSEDVRTEALASLVIRMLDNRHADHCARLVMEVLNRDEPSVALKVSSVLMSASPFSCEAAAPILNFLSEHPRVLIRRRAELMQS